MGGRGVAALAGVGGRFEGVVAMSKKVVFCADGTWDGPGGRDSDDTPDPTNVLKLFENLDGAEVLETVRQSGKERERVLRGADGSVRQIAYYLHGVGDSENPLTWLLGGALGTGLVVRIVRGYIFLSRSFAVDDRIYIIGFSRGAYTARALAGLVAARGLLDPAKVDLKDQQQALKLGFAVWLAHRRAQVRATDKVGWFERMMLELSGVFSSPPPADELVAVPIEAVGVWDTVGALGIPEYNKKKMRIDTFRFADCKLSPQVKYGRHAIAIDERRDDFTPTLWEPDPDRIKQRLFVGAHSDVGGGYPQSGGQSGLSDSALAWMTEELVRLGVLFSAQPVHPVRPDAKGMAHRPWTSLPWKLLPHGTPRKLPANGLELSPIVRERMAVGNVPVEGEDPRPYDPPNLPPSLS
jgi:uncharacterized protein (DUF2235 family)